MAVSLAQELIESILFCAYYDNHKQPDYTTLTACSTLCRSWSSPAQRLLFYHAKLSVSEAARLFRLASSSEHTRALIASIRCFDLDATTAGSLAEEVIVEAVTHCTGLYELALRANAVHSLSDDALEQLRNLAKRDITKPLRAIRLAFSVQSPLPYQILDIWPSVQFVRLERELASPHPRTYTPTFKLHELTLHRVPNVKNIEWLLSASIGHLRILEFRDQPGTLFNGIFRIHGPYLESLRLYHYSPRAKSILGMCPNLKEFIVMRLSSFLPLDGIPESLEHLGFRNYDWAANETLSPVIDVIDRLPDLKVVSSDPNARNHPDWGVLRTKCLGRGIKLTTDAAPIYVSEDPVPIKQFPRRRSVSNFATMNNAT